MDAYFLQKDCLTRRFPRLITDELSECGKTLARRWDGWKEQSPKGLAARCPATRRAAVTDPRKRSPDNDKVVRAACRWNPLRDFTRMREHFIATLRALPTAEKYRGSLGENYAFGEKMNYLRMDLKVCEGCGALWLRPGVSGGIYCKGCQATLADFPVARGRRVPLGPRRRRNGIHSVSLNRNRVAAVAGGAR